MTADEKLEIKRQNLELKMGSYLICPFCEVPSGPLVRISAKREPTIFAHKKCIDKT